MTEYERFRHVFTKTRVYKFGHRKAIMTHNSEENSSFEVLDVLF